LGCRDYGFALLQSGIILPSDANKEACVAKPTQTQILDQLLEKRHFIGADLEYLAQLQSIRHITFLPGSTFPKNGLQYLSRLRWLQFLHFHTCTLTPNDLTDVAALPKITSLHFTQCSITNDTVQYLRPSPRITYLSFINIPIAGQAVAHIAKFRSLTTLDLSGTAITDEDLVWLTQLPRLTSLLLHDTAIGDKGILSLATLRHLTGVYGRNSYITASGRDALFRAQLDAYHKRNKRFRKRAPDLDAVTEAKQTLLAFMEAYYQWETAVYRDGQQVRSERTTTDTNTPPYEGRDFWERLAQEHRELVAQFCTTEYQQHSYGLSYGTPPKLNPTTTQFVEVQYVTKSKLLLYTKEWSAIESYYEYTLAYENGRWRIAKRRWWMNGGWLSVYV